MSIEKSSLTIINNEVEVLEQSGMPGPPGFYYTPSISSDGILSWSNNGNLPNPEDFNLKSAGAVTSVNKKTGDVILQSKDIDYNNELTIKDALDQLLYVAPKITSFTGGGTYEKGQTITTVNLAWALNKEVQTQSLNNGIGDLGASARSYTVSGTITTDTTYTLTVNDGKNSASANTAVTFKQKRYWGVSEKTSLENADILAFSSEFATNRTQTRTFNCSGGKYFYVVIPTQMCSGISFKVGGLAFSAITSETIQLTNASGYESSYNVYRCNDIQTGSNISVQVL